MTVIHTRKALILDGDFIREKLTKEFSDRNAVNNRFSLRAFAKFLQVDCSDLSKILSGKKNVSRRIADQIVVRLGWDIKELSIQHATSNVKNGYKPLSLDDFRIIADWYHYAIFELITLQSFQPTINWIAKSLNISPLVARDAVNRLQRLGLLKWSVRKREVSRTVDRVTTTGHAVSAEALREHQRQVLTKAREALDSIPFENRDQSSLTISASSKKLPEVKALVKEFRRKLCDLLETDTAQKDQVYELSVSFFPLINT